MAAPYVSGAAALVLSACPGLTAATLKSTLLDSVDHIPALAGRTITGGRLNVDRAIRSCPVDLGLKNLTFTTGTYIFTAKTSLTASSMTIDHTASVTFTAGSYIRLLPEFRATAASGTMKFHAKAQ